MLHDLGKEVSTGECDESDTESLSDEQTFGVLPGRKFCLKKRRERLAAKAKDAKKFREEFRSHLEKLRGLRKGSLKRRENSRATSRKVTEKLQEAIELHREASKNRKKTLEEMNQRRELIDQAFEDTYRKLKNALVECQEMWESTEIENLEGWQSIRALEIQHHYAVGLFSDILALFKCLPYTEENIEFRELVTAEMQELQRWRESFRKKWMEIDDPIDKEPQEILNKLDTTLVAWSQETDPQKRELLEKQTMEHMREARKLFEDPLEAIKEYHQKKYGKTRELLAETSV